VGALLAIVIAIATELGARWWIRRRTGYYVLPPGLRLHIENDVETLPQLERYARFEVNSDGERGREAPRETVGTYRILVGGGSQPEGYLLDQHTSWPGAMQRLLDDPRACAKLGVSQVHVGSIARSGVGSEALDLIFSRTLPHYPRLQLIIILIGATDVLRWLENDAEGLAPPVLPPDVFRCHPEGPFSWRPSGLAAFEIVRRARRRYLRPVERDNRAGRWLKRARAMRAGAREVRHTMPDPTPMLDHFEFHFRRVLHKASSCADRVLVVRQPWFEKSYSPEEAAMMWHGGAGQAWREHVTTYYSFDVVSRLMALVDARAARISASLAVEQLDLMPWLPRSAQTYYDCFHLTPMGARAFAEAVTAAVLRLPLPELREVSARSGVETGELTLAEVS
jgi:hypothetical protein